MANIYLKYDVFRITGGFEVVIGDCSKLSKLNNMHGELRLSYGGIAIYGRCNMHGDCNVWRV